VETVRHETQLADSAQSRTRWTAGCAQLEVIISVGKSQHIW